jgi:hypothetical protein
MAALTKSAWFAAFLIAAASLTNCKEKKKAKACAKVHFDSAVIETCLGDVSYWGDAYDWLYEAEVEFEGQAYILSVELYGDFVQGGITAGPHELGVGEDANYATCANCILLIRCTDPGCNSPDAYFFPTAGTLELETLSQAGEGTLRGRLSQVHWVEVEIGAETFDSTPVPGGDCVDLTTDVTFDDEVDPWVVCSNIEFYAPTRELCYGEVSDSGNAYDWLYEYCTY